MESQSVFQAESQAIFLLLNRLPGLDLREGEEGDEISRVRRHADNDENPPEADDESSGVRFGHHGSAWG